MSLENNQMYLKGESIEAPASTQRREKRLPWSRMIKVDLLGTKGVDEPAEVEMSDVSGRGVGMRTSAAMLPGRRFSLRLRHAGKRAALMYQVRHATRNGHGEYLAGAELIGVIGIGFADHPERVIMAIMVGKLDETDA